MDYRWDLSVLYDGIDTEKYHKDEKLLSECVSKLVSLSEKTGKIYCNILNYESVSFYYKKIQKNMQV